MAEFIKAKAWEQVEQVFGHGSAAGTWHEWNGMRMPTKTSMCCGIIASLINYSRQFNVLVSCCSNEYFQYGHNRVTTKVNIVSLIIKDVGHYAFHSIAFADRRLPVPVQLQQKYDTRKEIRFLSSQTISRLGSAISLVFKSNGNRFGTGV